MPRSNTITHVRDLSYNRRRRGLTQADMARLMSVSQQAVAKWEASGEVPSNRMKRLAEVLRLPLDALRYPTVDKSGGVIPEHAWKAAAREACVDQIVVCFDGLTMHYTPNSEEVRTFWSDLQGGGWVHLSAGPVQALINMDAAKNIDFNWDPDLDQYDPSPETLTRFISKKATLDGPGARTGILTVHSEVEVEVEVEVPEGIETPESDHTSPEDEYEAEANKWWFERNEARVFVQNRTPYVAEQAKLLDLFEDEDVTPEDVEGIEGNSIFDLFTHLMLCVDFNDDDDPDPDLRPTRLCVFETEGQDATTTTWLHLRDIQVIEVPTRLWELYQDSFRKENERNGLGVLSESSADKTPPAKRKPPKKRKATAAQPVATSYRYLEGLKAKKAAEQQSKAAMESKLPH